ncbi:MAG: lipoyl(octanoyl) transferase LipB [Bacteroidota bacterium]
MSKKTQFIHLGLKDYKEAWDFQERLFKQTVEQKIVNRNVAQNDQIETKNHLIFCEHPHVYTLGKSGDENHLLANQAFLKKKHASFYKINRGGDITYHGPGQIVGYPILDLDHFFTDIHKYLRFLEEAVIQTLKEYGVKSGRINGLTGVWLDWENEKKAKKICALGVRSSRWVTMHGFALNVNTNLEYFNYIVPCGIPEKAVTSLAKELGKEIDIKEVEEKLKRHLVKIFEMELVQKTLV